MRVLLYRLVQHDWLDGGQEFTLAPQGFHESFCAHVPAADAAFYAISQRPLAGVALSEPAPTQAWRGRPVWGVFGYADRCIDPRVHRFSYDRMGATVTEVEGESHVVMISHPQEVAEVVMTAVRRVSKGGSTERVGLGGSPADGCCERGLISPFGAANAHR